MGSRVIHLRLVGSRLLGSCRNARTWSSVKDGCRNYLELSPAVGSGNSGRRLPPIECPRAELADALSPWNSCFQFKSSTGALSLYSSGLSTLAELGLNPAHNRNASSPLHTNVSSVVADVDNYDSPADSSSPFLEEAMRHEAMVHAAAAGMAAPVDWQKQRVKVRELEETSRIQPVDPPTLDVEPADVYIPVKAFYISRSVDLKGLAAEPFSDVTIARNNLIIRCTDRPPGSSAVLSNPGNPAVSERYMVAFQYGSVVFFNFRDQEEEDSLNAVRKYCTDQFRESRKDDYGVVVRPTLASWSEGGHDRIMLKKLDTDNIRVISSILGQSIALDHYAKKVDEMVNTFSELNRGMEQTGTFTMTRKKLFQLVAAANTTLADVILRLGLLERSDAAWKDANYAQIWEYLRDDFELDERFESLDFKLNIIQHNVRFFLEILQNRKSDTLEWIIILLITGEICVSLYDILHTAKVL